ncbi:ferric reductase [Nocardioides sp. GY 10113]|uniref:ferric reductase n=1 Tax=Nocardioides sp. GY 10113 TaxID=2569761 RepID=UPI0010A853F7|nr:ferric reductase [Nocardioides sp. GY 10113]TIC88315.1 ferric reductase [Nocardioides sp. GY 10113]
MTLWFLARSAGFVAVLAATLTVALGAAGTASRGDARVLAQLVHRSAAVLTLAMLALHAGLLVADHYVDVTPGGALLPFTAGYRGPALGLGTLAGYGFVVLALTGALRGRMAASEAAARTWRGVHLTAYGAWVLAMAHGVLAGTDSGTPWAVLLYGGCATVVVGTVAARVIAGLAHADDPLPRARQGVRRPVQVPTTARRPLTGGTR